MLGSLLTTAYVAGLPSGAPKAAGDSLGGAIALGDPALAETARSALTDAMTQTMIIGAALTVLSALVAFVALKKPVADRPEVATAVPDEVEAAV